MVGFNVVGFNANKGFFTFYNVTPEEIDKIRDTFWIMSIDYA